MAIGLSLFFGIHLPVNFNSPYKATSIIDFWRRWHISLSTFLKDYLYIPLGGNKFGINRRYLNLFITMLLGGLWHGANWTFVLWGAAHGTFLIINHWWRSLFGKRCEWGMIGMTASAVLTFICVCFAWVLFRADSLSTARAIYRGMLGLNGVSLPFGMERMISKVFSGPFIVFEGFWQGSANGSSEFFLLMALVCSITWFLPNVNDWPYKREVFFAKKRLAVSIITGLLFAISVSFIAQNSPFLYFQF